MAQNSILNVAHASPHGIKTNCYTFALGPRIGFLGYAERKTKAQPGERCGTRGPLPFHNRQRAVQELRKRVLCDNPAVVVPLRLNRTILFSPVPKGFHLMVAILGTQDYHFLRRVSRVAVLKDPHFSASVKARVRRLRRPYLWAHVRGWSNGVKLVDAKGNLVLSPVPKSAQVPFEIMRSDFKYDSLHYDTFAGVWLVKSRAAKVGVTSSPIQQNIVDRVLEK